MKVWVSTQYTGTRQKAGKWVKPKRYTVSISKREKERVGKNKAIYLQLKKKKTLKRKDFAWW